MYPLPKYYLRQLRKHYKWIYLLHNCNQIKFNMFDLVCDNVYCFVFNCNVNSTVHCLSAQFVQLSSDSTKRPQEKFVLRKTKFTSSDLLKLLDVN